ncbi:MAG TPA: hypothetical protein VJ986_06000 [Gaiellaceae bacterium]|nr:hypothetical protein [Gaiellaceae bacterium]
MPDIVIGTLAGLAAAAIYAAGIALQALEAREAPAERALRFSLFRSLVARPRWVAGTALGLTGWIVQAFALAHAPLTLVQPLLGTSLVFLLGISVWTLGERVGRREQVAVLAIAAGVPLLALTAPTRDADHAAGLRLWLALALLGAAALVPLFLRGSARSASVLVPVGAGLAYSWDGLATKFASDDYVRHLWPGLLFWVVGMGIASGLGTLSEMSALQRRPVAHVAPVVFALTTFVPVGLAPLLAREWWPASPLRDAGIVAGLAATAAGALALARAEPVARVLETASSRTPSGTARSPRVASDDLSAASDARP